MNFNLQREQINLFRLISIAIRLQFSQDIFPMKTKVNEEIL